MRVSDVPALPPALELDGVGKRYPGAVDPALSDVSLRVGPGELVAVVGASGCGKTTLLRLIAGLEFPDEGVIRLGGQVVAGEAAWVPPERRGVGLVFQDFALFPHLCVSDNVAYGLRHLPRAERRARTGQMLELVGLNELRERYPHQLSGGQQQRVALARALAPAPRLLLLDEPFSNLDTPLKIVLQKELARLLEASGVPTLLVVHEVEDIVALADRVAVMREGHVVREGTPVGLHTSPGDAYVAGFFARLRIPGCVPTGPFLDEASGTG
ncbi:MAG: ABC transporter ATP-binding protein [Gemmatimonadota bacterium]